MELTLGIVVFILALVLTWAITRNITQAKFRQRILFLEKQNYIEKESRKHTEERLQQMKKDEHVLKEELKNAFDSLAIKALDQNSDRFNKLAKEAFESTLQKSESNLEKKEIAIKNIVEPLSKSLEKHEKMVQDLEKNSSKTFGNINHFLSQLSENQDKLTNETNALVTALKNPKVRGKWGEIGLRKIVEFSGMNAYCDFTEQVHVEDEKGRLRPDMLVNLPGDFQVVVDSKLPLDAYLKALEIGDEQEKNRLLSLHAKAMRDHMTQLSKKEYWSQFESADFVVMYVELESAFSAAMEKDKNLIQDGMNNRIVFATPTTLITLLKTVAYSWKQEGLTENAKQIWKSGKELHDRLRVFAEHLNNVGKGLKTANESYNKAIGSWDNRVKPGIRNLEELGVSSKKEIPGSKPVESLPRSVEKDKKGE